MMADDFSLKVPKHLRRGTRSLDEHEAIGVGAHLIELMCHRIGIPSLEGKSVLDIGCGHRLAQAILERDIPVGHYVGLDVFAELIDHMQRHVQDPRFEFHRIDVHNEMYNPTGVKLRSDTTLPVEEATFDVICLFSVFTHLNPEDFDAMLRVTRRYLRAQGRLFFSAFISKTQPTPFLDAVPNKPLQWAYYNEAFAHDLIRNAGWKVISQHPPERWIQEHFVCVPTL